MPLAAERAARRRVAEATVRRQQHEKNLLLVMEAGDATAEAAAVEKLRSAQRDLFHAEALLAAVLH